MMSQSGGEENGSSLQSSVLHDFKEYFEDLLAAEEYAYRRSDFLYGTGRLGSSIMFQEYDVETEGIQLLRQSDFISEIHEHFRKFEAYRCCTLLVGGHDTSSCQVRIACEDAISSTIMSPYAQYASFNKSGPAQLSEEEMRSYRKALLCARFPVLTDLEFSVLDSTLLSPETVEISEYKTSAEQYSSSDANKVKCNSLHKATRNLSVAEQSICGNVDKSVVESGAETISSASSKNEDGLCCAERICLEEEIRERSLISHTDEKSRTDESRTDESRTDEKIRMDEKSRTDEKCRTDEKSRTDESLTDEKLVDFSLVSSEVLTGRVNCSFGIYGNEINNYLRLIFCRKDKKGEDLLAAEDLAYQLYLMENNRHPIYNHSQFLTERGFEHWKDLTRKSCLSLLSKFWKNQTFPSVRGKEIFNAAVVHKDYEVLLCRLFWYEDGLTHHRRSDSAAGLLIKLSPMAHRCLTEFSLRYGIGEIYQKQVLLQYLSCRFQMTCDYLDCVNVHVTQVMKINQTINVMLISEVLALRKCATTLLNSCEESFIDFHLRFTEVQQDENASGFNTEEVENEIRRRTLSSLVSLMSSIIDLLNFLSDDERCHTLCLDDVLTRTCQGHFESIYSDHSKKIARRLNVPASLEPLIKEFNEKQFQLKKQQQQLLQSKSSSGKNRQSSKIQSRQLDVTLQAARMINCLISCLRDELQSCINIFEPVLNKYMCMKGVVHLAAQIFYGKLMNDIQEKVTKPAAMMRHIEFAYIGLIYRMNNLDQDWSTFIDSSSRMLWRKMYYSVLSEWSLVMQSNIKQLLIRSLAHDKFEYLKCTRCAVSMDDYEMRYCSPRNSTTNNELTASLTRSLNSAFSHVEPVKSFRNVGLDNEVFEHDANAVRRSQQSGLNCHCNSFRPNGESKQNEMLSTKSDVQKVVDEGGVCVNVSADVHQVMKTSTFDETNVNSITDKTENKNILNGSMHSMNPVIISRINRDEFVDVSSYGSTPVAAFRPDDLSLIEDIDASDSFSSCDSLTQVGSPAQSNIESLDQDQLERATLSKSESLTENGLKSDNVVCSTRLNNDELYGEERRPLLCEGNGVLVDKEFSATESTDLRLDRNTSNTDIPCSCSTKNDNKRRNYTEDSSTNNEKLLTSDLRAARLNYKTENLVSSHDSFTIRKSDSRRHSDTRTQSDDDDEIEQNSSSVSDVNSPTEPRGPVTVLVTQSFIDFISLLKRFLYTSDQLVTAVYTSAILNSESPKRSSFVRTGNNCRLCDHVVSTTENKGNNNSEGAVSVNSIVHNSYPHEQISSLSADPVRVSSREVVHSSQVFNSSADFILSSPVSERSVRSESEVENFSAPHNKHPECLPSSSSLHLSSCDDVDPDLLSGTDCLSHQSLHQIVFNLRRQTNKVLVSVMLIYIKNMLFMDLCGLDDDLVHQLAASDEIAEEIKAERHRPNVLAGCRHKINNRSCYEYSHRKAEFIGQQFEPITVDMCARINALSQLEMACPRLFTQAYKLESNQRKDSQVDTSDDQADHLSDSRGMKWLINYTVSVRETCINILSYRLNLFVSATMRRLLDTDLAGRGLLDRGLDVLIRFLNKRLEFLRASLKLSDFLQCAKTLWLHISQNVEVLIRGQNSVKLEQMERRASNIRQILMGLSKFYFNKFKDFIDDNIFTNLTCNAMYWLSLYFESSASLMNICDLLIHHSTQEDKCERRSVSEQSDGVDGGVGGGESDVGGVCGRRLKMMQQDLHRARKNFSGQALVDWISSHPRSRDADVMSEVQEMLMSGVLQEVRRGEGSGVMVRCDSEGRPILDSLTTERRTESKELLSALSADPVRESDVARADEESKYCETDTIPSSNETVSGDFNNKSNVENGRRHTGERSVERESSSDNKDRRGPISTQSSVEFSVASIDRNMMYSPDLEVPEFRTCSRYRLACFDDDGVSEGRSLCSSVRSAVSSNHTAGASTSQRAGETSRDLIRSADRCNESSDWGRRAGAEYYRSRGLTLSLVLAPLAVQAHKTKHNSAKNYLRLLPATVKNQYPFIKEAVRESVLDCSVS